MSTTTKERYEVLQRLQKLGLDYEDANRLRRIAMTLRRWFELECGDSNQYKSWAIERDEKTDAPYMVEHMHLDAGQGGALYGNHGTYRTRIPDREQGARKRLAKMMEKYPTLTYYIQTDPRGASLYILTVEQVGTDNIDSIYNRGVAVY